MLDTSIAPHAEMTHAVGSASVSGQVDVIARKYAAELAAGRPGVSPAPTDFHRAFARDLVNKNGFALEWITNGLNDKAKAVFTEFTGLELPRGIAASWAVLRQWAGITEEQDALAKAQARLSHPEQALRSLIGAPDFEVVKSWTLARIAEGFDRVVHAPGKWMLVNQEGVGFDLSKKGTVLPKARAFIEASCDLHKAEVAHKVSLSGSIVPEGPDAVQRRPRP